MPPNPYDQACRFLLRLFAAPLLAWLLRLSPDKLDLLGWLDAHNLPWPGQPDRVCDTVAHLRDPERGGLPWAVPVEFQIDPDPEMFGRGLGYLAGLWQGIRPTPRRGDRFEVGLVVVNLRGRGRSSRRMRLTGTRLFTAMRPVERNLARIPADGALRHVEAGRWPAALLVWIPLSQGADDPAIISEWRRLALLQTDADVRKVMPLALLFAEAAGRAEIWKPALEGWSVIESKVIQEWTALARDAAVKKGKIEWILRTLRRIQPVPADLEQAVRAIEDDARLETAFDAALSSATLDDFRRATGL